jgi:hypothetical protein
LTHLGLFLPPYADLDILSDELIKWEPLIAAITRLPYLEDLALELPIFAEWCRHFENCSHLRKIEWTLPTALDDRVYDVLMSSLRHLARPPLVTFVVEPGDNWDEESEIEQDEFDAE